MRLQDAIYRPTGSFRSRLKAALMTFYVNVHLRAEEGKPSDWYVQIDRMEER